MGVVHRLDAASVPGSSPKGAGCVPEAPPALQTGLTEPASMMQERMLAGGSARNRMLVKGGSSFNALVRALKQDVVTGAAPKAIRNEQLMYDVDRVSLVNQPAALETTALQADHLKSGIFLKCAAINVFKQARPSDGIMRGGQTGAQAAAHRQMQQGTCVVYSNQTSGGRVPHKTENEAVLGFINSQPVCHCSSPWIMWLSSQMGSSMCKLPGAGMPHLFSGSLVLQLCSGCGCPVNWLLWAPAT